MESSDLEVHGEWPHLRGQTCDALIAEEYWHEGKLDVPANVVWLRVGVTWHRLAIDCAVIFWRRSEVGPGPYEMPELGSEVRLRDLGHELGLVGGIIEAVAGTALPAGGVEVRVRLRSGKEIAFHHVNDSTTYYTG